MRGDPDWPVCKSHRRAGFQECDCNPGRIISTCWNDINHSTCAGIVNGRHPCECLCHSTGDWSTNISYFIDEVPA